MSPVNDSLDALRREIDEIDRAMHDLLIQRAGLSGRVRSAKGGANATIIHPAREAEIIRRLVRRHSGSLPPRFIVRLWREIISAMTRLQGSFTVAVFAPKGETGLLHLAHDHFGGGTPCLPMGAAGSVLSAVADGEAAVGVLPLPEDPRVDAWWRHLALESAKPMRILARLPFARVPDEPEALVVGCQPFEPTGEDRGYLLVETTNDVSRTRLSASLEATGLKAVSFADADVSSEAPSGPRLQLVETDPYCGDDDPALASFVERLGEGVARVRSLGGYAVPVAVPIPAS
jgi:chorismate mutase